MTNLEQAARQALEALNTIVPYEVVDYDPLALAISALRQALEQPTVKDCLKVEQPKQEPVAWATMPEADDWCFVSGSKDPNKKLKGVWVPLYTEPPQRNPLTRDQALKIVAAHPDVMTAIRMTESAHGIKE